VTEIANDGLILSGTTGYLGGYAGGGLDYPSGLAIDGSGNVWVTNYFLDGNTLNGNSVTEIIGVATPVITPICAGLPATPTANGTSNLGTRP
jgi:hypothetical protein